MPAKNQPSVSCFAVQVEVGLPLRQGAEAAGAEADGGGSPGSGGLVCREVARAAARSRSNQPTTDPTRSPRESDRVPPTVPRGLLQLGAAPDATPWEMDLLG